jgi:hypothetical protein
VELPLHILHPLCAQALWLPADFPTIAQALGHAHRLELLVEPLI